MRIQEPTELSTPALVLDWPAAKKNIQTAVDWIADKPARLRPHFKSHRCTTLARHQIDAGGCVGMTVSSVGEAHVLVHAGIDDVLIANQVVDPTHVDEVISLTEKAVIRVAVDSSDQVDRLAAAAAKRGVTLGVLVEVDLGLGRCGVPPGEAALILAKRIAQTDGLRFDGLLCYEGSLNHIHDSAVRAEAARQAMDRGLETRRLLESSGLDCAILAGGGTCTFQAVGTLDLVDELQIGCYVTMDWYYAPLVDYQFDIALRVAARVISVRENQFVLNVGSKGLGCENGPPRIGGLAMQPSRVRVNEEHCVVEVAKHNVRIGDLIWLEPSHCCTTCNLYRDMFIQEHDKIVDRWPIEASGYPANIFSASS